MKSAIACVLKKEGYISEYTEENTNPGKILTVTLKYHDGVSVIEDLKRVSRPSCRIYCGSGEIPKIKNGLGTVVLSTSEGIMASLLFFNDLHNWCNFNF
jgi:small subunit ribosomal protein S8